MARGLRTPAANTAHVRLRDASSPVFRKPVRSSATLEQKQASTSRFASAVATCDLGSRSEEAGKGKPIDGSSASCPPGAGFEDPYWATVDEPPRLAVHPAVPISERPTPWCQLVDRDATARDWDGNPPSSPGETTPGCPGPGIPRASPWGEAGGAFLGPIHGLAPQISASLKRL